MIEKRFWERFKSAITLKGSGVAVEEKRQAIFFSLLCDYSQTLFPGTPAGKENVVGQQRTLAEMEEELAEAEAEARDFEPIGKQVAPAEESSWAQFQWTK